MSKNTSKTYSGRSAATDSPSAQLSTPEPVATTCQFTQPQQFEYNSTVESRSTYLPTEGQPSLNLAPTYQSMYSSNAVPVTSTFQPAQPQDFEFEFDTMAPPPRYLTARERRYIDPTPIDPALIDSALIDPALLQPVPPSTPEPDPANSQSAEFPEIGYYTMAPPSPDWMQRQGTPPSPIAQPRDLYLNTLRTYQPMNPWRRQPATTTSQFGRPSDSEFGATWLDQDTIPATYGYQSVQPVTSLQLATRGGSYSNPWLRPEDLESQIPTFASLEQDEGLAATPAPPSPSLPVVQQPPPPTTAAAAVTTDRPRRHSRKALRHGCTRCPGIHFQCRAIKSARSQQNTVENHVRQCHPEVSRWEDLATHWGHRFYYPSGRAEDVPRVGQAASQRMPEGRRAGAGASGASRVRRREENKKANESAGAKDEKETGKGGKKRK